MTRDELDRFQQLVVEAYEYRKALQAIRQLEWSQFPDEAGVYAYGNPFDRLREAQRLALVTLRKFNQLGNFQ